MKRFIFFFFLTPVLFVSYGQDSLELEQKAIRIERQDILGDDIYYAICGYRLIMVGEVHGTNEPARFVGSLANLLTMHNRKVQIGMEIPPGQMKKYWSTPSDSNILGSYFFATKRSDSRACFAWVSLLEKFIGNPQVEFFFFDVDTVTSGNFKARDSLMYINIKKRVMLHPSWNTITLSGNVHNMLIPYDGEIKMGLYLLNDKDLSISNKMLSLNHFSATGQNWDNSRTGLQLRTIDNSNSVFTKISRYNNYLFIYPPDVRRKYNGIYFTRAVTVSKFTNSK